MNMKEHILAALRELYQGWEALLASLPEEQATAPLPGLDWSVQDHLAHLWAWQQRSIARIEAALDDREPDFPRWLPGVDVEVDGNTEPVNAWIYETYHHQPWAETVTRWRTGFQRFLATIEQVSERDLLDSSRYAWLGGTPLANVLIGSYDHHQEHYELVTTGLKAHES